MSLLFSRLFFGMVILFSFAHAQETNFSAQDFAARLSDRLQDGSSVVRLKMNIHPSAAGTKTILQLQVKSRRTKEATDILYHILWPKDRKGESFVLHQSGNQAPTGAVFTLPNSLVMLTPAKMKDGIFGSDLSFDDLIENFFVWEHQSIVGNETLGGAQCYLLESKPGKNDRTHYSRVKSWIDPKRMVTLRVEKYSEAGKLAKRIDTTRVAKDDTGKFVASSFSLQRSEASLTEIEGSNSKHGVTFSANEFSPETLRTLK